MTTGSCPARVMTTSSRSSITALRVSAYFARDSEYVMVFITLPPLDVQEIVLQRGVTHNHAEGRSPTNLTIFAELVGCQNAYVLAGLGFRKILRRLCRTR